MKALKPKGDEKPNLVEIRKKANEIIEKYKVRTLFWANFCFENHFRVLINLMDFCWLD